jgi:signal transduction histidine kinase
LAQLNFQLKNYDKSKAFYGQRLDWGNKIGNPETITEVYHGYSLIDSVKGNYLSALKNYAQYMRLNDSLINANKSRIVSLYQVKSDLQKRADENEKLKIEQEKDQSIILHQHVTEIILVVGLVIIALGLVYLISINNRAKNQSLVINKQNKILESNNLVKDKLFSVISHDLRSPITQVIGLLNLWEEGDVKHQELSELTPVVKKRIVQTLDLLDNLLIWSNNQLQGFKFKAQPFGLDVMVNDILQNLKTTITQKSLKVENMITPETIVYADSEMIKIVLRNLISNSIKFTPARGSIKIKSNYENGFTVIAVEDTGIGIKEEDMPKIFSFTTHTTLGTGNEKGTGMGLKICKDFIELNHGSIRMESKENVGSTFYVSIPQNVNL